MKITERAALVLQQIDEQLAIAKLAEEDAKEPHWWCPVCLREVSPQMVRYNETHDGCGASVELHEPAPRTGYPLALECLKTAIEGLLSLATHPLTAGVERSVATQALTESIEKWEAGK